MSILLMKNNEWYGQNNGVLMKMKENMCNVRKEW